jgi:hypothetical protein
MHSIPPTVPDADIGPYFFFGFFLKRQGVHDFGAKVVAGLK